MDSINQAATKPFSRTVKGADNLWHTEQHPVAREAVYWQGCDRLFGTRQEAEAYCLANDIDPDYANNVRAVPAVESADGGSYRLLDGGWNFA